MVVSMLLCIDPRYTDVIFRHVRSCRASCLRRMLVSNNHAVVFSPSSQHRPPDDIWKPLTIDDSVASAWNGASCPPSRV